MEDESRDTDLVAPMLDAIALFEALGIDYALVGGLAAMYYGRARFTQDVDFIASQGHEQAFADNPDAMRRHHFDPGCTWKLYHNSGVEIYVWRDDFVPSMLARAGEATLAGRSVRVVDVHDLIAMKLRAGRPQDDYDVSEILKRTDVDEPVVQSRVSPEQFTHFIDIKRRIGI